LGAYAAQAKESLSQREKEAHALVKAANSMQKLIENMDGGGATVVSAEDIEVTLDYNRQLWALFYEKAEEQLQKAPDALSQNIISLGNFVFMRSRQISKETNREVQKHLFSILVDINRQIATGLFSAR
jgi:flagellar biosynthesis regulator FlaF